MDRIGVCGTSDPSSILGGRTLRFFKEGCLERLMGQVSKTLGGVTAPRGFESHPLRFGYCYNVVYGK